MPQSWQTENESDLQGAEHDVDSHRLLQKPGAIAKGTQVVIDDLTGPLAAATSSLRHMTKTSVACASISASVCLGQLFLAQASFSVSSMPFHLDLISCLCLLPPKPYVVKCLTENIWGTAPLGSIHTYPYWPS